MSKLYMIGGLVAAAVIGAQFFGKGRETVTVGSGSDLTGAAKRDAAVLVAKGDPAMEAARAKARAGLDAFLQHAAGHHPAKKKFAVKLALRDGETVEYMWVARFEPDGDGFIGILNNTPRMIKTAKSGDTMRFRRDDIYDWMYVEGGVIKGNFTGCALLAKEAPADREKFLKQFPMDCSA